MKKELPPELFEFFTLLEDQRKNKIVTTPSQIQKTEERQLIEKTLGFLGGDTKTKTQDPLTPLDQNFITKKDFEKHYQEFISRVQHQLSTIGGGGEVNFRYLDDVNRSTMTNSNDNWVLEYDAATKKVQFTKDIGAIDTVLFDKTHVDDPLHTEGTICWSAEDKTLNITHQNGVKQQVGQESYYVVKNVTGSQIDNGTFCMFAGVTQNGINRLDAAPFVADGTYPNLFGIGVATEDIADGAIGFVTNFGVVRDVDTTGTPVGEVWNVGDILYANPSFVGKLTNVKPTAPNNVLPVAAVILKDATAGEIFVRPTFEQRMDYATISSSADQTITTINTPKAITFNTLEENQGISYNVSNPSRIEFTQSGLYSIDFNAQALSTNASEKKIWFWVRKNGTDIPYSSRLISIVGNSEYSVFHVTHNISVDANDYIEFFFASDSTDVVLKAESATAFAPAAPSAHIHIDQGAL